MIKKLLFIFTIFFILYPYKINSDQKYFILFVSSNGAYLPILIDGREVGKTNGKGDQYVKFLKKYGSEITVSLVTKKGINLEPQNPTKTFKLVDKRIYIFKQIFLKR